MSSYIRFSGGKSGLALPLWSSNKGHCCVAVVNQVTFWGLYDKTDCNTNFVYTGKWSWSCCLCPLNVTVHEIITWLCRQWVKSTVRNMARFLECVFLYLILSCFYLLSSFALCFPSPLPRVTRSKCCFRGRIGYTWTVERPHKPSMPGVPGHTLGIRPLEPRAPLQTAV